MKFLLVKVNGSDWLRLMLKVRSDRRWMPGLQNEFPSCASYLCIKSIIYSCILCYFKSKCSVSYETRKSSG